MDHQGPPLVAQLGDHLSKLLDVLIPYLHLRPKQYLVPVAAKGNALGLLGLQLLPQLLLHALNGTPHHDYAPRNVVPRIIFFQKRDE